MIEILWEFARTVNAQILTRSFPILDPPKVDSVVHAIDLIQHLLSYDSKVSIRHFNNLLEIASSKVQELNNLQKYRLINTVTKLLSMKRYFAVKNQQVGLNLEDAQQLLNLFKLMCKYIATIPFQYYDWLDPMVDEAQYFDVTNQSIYAGEIVQLFNKTSITFGFYNVFFITQKKVEEYLNFQDWRYRYGAYYCIDTLYIKIDHIKRFQILQKASRDPHPKIRYLAAFLIDKHGQSFGKSQIGTYFALYAKLIINGIKDEIEIISSRWLFCLKNLLNSSDCFNLIKQNIEQVNSKCFSLIRTGENRTKKIGLQFLQIISKPSYKYYTQGTINIPFQLFKQILYDFQVEGNKQVLSKIYTTFTILIQNQPIRYIKNYYEFAILIAIHYQNSIFFKQWVEGWCRLCSENYRFKNWKSLFNTILKYNKNIQFRYHDLWLTFYLKSAMCLRQQFRPYVTDALSHIYQINPNNAETESQYQTLQLGLSTIVQILTCCSNGPSQEEMNLVKYNITNLQNLAAQHFKYKNMRLCVIFTHYQLQLLLNCPCFYEQAQIKTKFHYFMQFIDNVFAARDEFLYNQPSDMLNDHQVPQTLQQKVVMCQKCNFNITIILRVLLAKTKQIAYYSQIMVMKTKPIFETKYNRSQKQIGLQKLVMLFDVFEFNQISTNWKQIRQTIFTYSQAPEIPLRIHSIYGLLVIARRIPMDSPYIELSNWIDLIKKCQRIPKGVCDSQRVYQSLKIICSSAIGQIILKFHKMFALKHLYKPWLKSMPIFNNYSKTDFMKRFCLMLISEPNVFISQESQIEDLSMVLGVFGRCNYTPSNKAYIVAFRDELRIIRLALKHIFEWGIMKLKKDEVLKMLESKQRDQIEELLADNPFLDEKEQEIQQQQQQQP